MNNIVALLNERSETHGRYARQCEITQRLKRVMIESGLHSLPDTHVEALDMIALKIGRIFAGDSNFADHWDDIAGYAKLVADEVR
jgi:hypothetical protein